MDIRRFNPALDGESVRACHETHLAGAPIDDPAAPPMSARTFAAWMIYGWTEDPSEAWLEAGDDGQASGWYVLGLPSRENRQLAYLTVMVHPARRRAGLGTALVRHAAQRAAEHGRTVLAGESRQEAAGTAFACALGAEQALTEVHRVLRLRSVPVGHLNTLRKQAEYASAGYSLVVWEGLVPDDQSEPLIGVYAAEADAPRRVSEEALVWDADRLRLSRQRAAAQGCREYTVVARHDASGDLAGLTQLAVDPATPDWAFQQLTVVARPHRGHRLGLLVKVAMLDLLADREPQLERIITGNASSNAHMIAINEALGFEVLDHWPSWALPVSRALGAGHA
jgi:GNAT superfamily N-acetyltransferase/RimJ/RimL family protein N-acetyltransferase